MGSGFIRREPDWARPPWDDGHVAHLLDVFRAELAQGKLITADARLVVDALEELLRARDEAGKARTEIIERLDAAAQHANQGRDGRSFGLRHAADIVREMSEP